MCLKILKHKPDTLWLEFGVASGNTINYISKFTNDKVYGFDGDTGELRACYKFNLENKIDYEWICMNGTPTGMTEYYHEMMH